MRVVIISKALVVGAYRRKLEELASLPGVELTAIVPPRWGDRRGAVALEPGYARNYTLSVAPLALNGQYHLHFYPTIGRMLHRLRPDVLHMDEEPYNLATWQVLRIGRRIDAQTLFFTWQNLQRRYPWPFSHFERANFRRAGWAIAGNEEAARILACKGFERPVSVIPQFGVDPLIFVPQPRPHPGFAIGYAGGLVPEKGVDLLLRACAGLPAGWSLHIAGEGPERARLEGLAAEYAEGQVHFAGRLASGDLPEFYNGLDVLVLPSISRPNWIEQFGRVLIEAMACGVPVIGSSSGEIPHVIGDAGIIFPEGDVTALRDALARLEQDKSLRDRLREDGRGRVLDNFTQARIAQETYQVYRRLMEASA